MLFRSDALKSEDHKRIYFCVLSTAVRGSFLVCTSGNIPLSLSLPTSMARGLPLTSTVGLTVLIALVLVHPTCCAPTAMVNHTCSASSCGNIHNISFPFRLKTDPENCGDFSLELSCENNRTVLYISRGKYYVQEISYNNYTNPYCGLRYTQGQLLLLLHPDLSFILILSQFLLSILHLPTKGDKGELPGSRTISECGFDEL